MKPYFDLSGQWLLLVKLKKIKKHVLNGFGRGHVLARLLQSKCRMGHVFDATRNNNTSAVAWFTQWFCDLVRWRMAVCEPFMWAVYCFLNKKLTAAKKNEYKAYKNNKQNSTFWLKRTSCDLIKGASTYLLAVASLGGGGGWGAARRRWHHFGMTPFVVKPYYDVKP